VLCFIAVPLPPGTNPFAVKINNNNNKIKFAQPQNNETVKAPIFNIVYGKSTATGECGISQLFGCMIRNDARCTHEIKNRIATAKAAFDKKKTLFTRKLDLNLGKKLVKCNIWSIALLWR
jgi:hypothetical protein